MRSEDVMKTRLDRTAYFSQMAWLVAERGTCARRKVGCVLINERGHVLATGYNGPPAGFPHCIDEPCAGATAESGTDLDLCEAIHAEQNALLQCPDVHAIHTAFVTATPCITCIKLLLNTSCELIVFDETYPHAAKVLAYWVRGNRKWKQWPS